jgi:hypothetical protein
MRLRTWFLRDVVDAIEREHTGGVQDRLKARLPERLAEHLDSGRLRDAAPTDTISLDDGEELLLAVDSALGNGSGRVLEEAALGLATRVLSQGGGVAVIGDLLGTMRRMRAPLERPFVDVDLVFELTETDTGFSLTLGIAGRPRSARMLRHLGVGTIRAAHRFSRETDDGDFKLYAEVSADRANISARYRQPVSQPGTHEEAPTPSRRPSRKARSVTQPRLADEVERILGHGASAPPPADEVRRRPSTMPPPRTSLVADVSPPSVPPVHSPSGVRARGMIDQDETGPADPESGTGSSG